MSEKKELQVPDFQEMQDIILRQVCAAPEFQELPGLICLQIASYCTDAAEKAFHKGVKAAKEIE